MSMLAQSSVSEPNVDRDFRSFCLSLSLSHDHRLFFSVVSPSLFAYSCKDDLSQYFDVKYI